jgi:transcriptional regulator with XRE-family HTH domain
MLHDDQPKTTSERLEELVSRLESSESYDIEAAKFDISEHIFSVMEGQRVSKAKLANRLGKSRAYITKILQGNANFTLESLVKIARALDCKLDLRHVMIPARQEVPAFDWSLLGRGSAHPARRPECEYIRLLPSASAAKKSKNPPSADKENNNAAFEPAA